MRTKTKFNMFFAGSMAMVMFFSFFNFFTVDAAKAALVPGGSVGPVNAITGFPEWYQDQNGLTLDLMEAADPFGISDPVDPGNDFSELIGFNAEGFWWSSEASMDTASGGALLVLALEAAFVGEEAVDGEQSAFGRVRIRVDVPQAGNYTVTHPYGQQTYNISAADVGNGFEINDTSDIGCFAIAGVISCDPNNPPGNPFNFGLALQSDIGPFLTWDTFNPNPALTDPALINPLPAYANRQYVGNPSIEHAVTGSPLGQNFFRVAGPNIGGQNINLIETQLFSVAGRLAQLAPVNQPPVVNPIPAQSAVVGNELTFIVSAIDPDDDVLNFSLGVTAPAGAVIDPVDGVFSWTPGTAGTFNFDVLVSDGVNPAVTAPVSVVVSDVVPPPVNQPPVANPDLFTTPARRILTIPFSSLLANDTDPNGDPIRIAGVEQGVGGRVRLNSLRLERATEVRFTPDSGFVGAANFTYTIEDTGGLQFSALVTIEVGIIGPPPPPPPPPAENRPPVAVDDGPFTTSVGVPLTILVSSLLANDSDPDVGDAVTFFSVRRGEGARTVRFDRRADSVVFTPARGFTGVASFTYTIRDNDRDSATATVTVNVTP